MEKSNSIRSGKEFRDTPILFMDNGRYSIKASYFPREIEFSEETNFLEVPTMISKGHHFIRKKADIQEVLGETLKEYTLQEYNDNPAITPKGELLNFEDLSYIWGTICNVLDNTAEDVVTNFPIIQTENIGNSKDNRRKMCELAFEQLGAPQYYLTNPAILATISELKSTAIVIDLGESETRIVPVKDGFACHKLTKNFHIAGEDINEYIMRNIPGMKMDSLYGHYILGEFKKRKNIPPNTNYTLEDGSSISISNDIYKEATNKYFSPQLGSVQTNMHSAAAQFLGFVQTVQEKSIVTHTIASISDYLKEMKYLQNIFDSILITGNIFIHLVNKYLGGMSMYRDLTSQICMQLKEKCTDKFAKITPKHCMFQNVAPLQGAKIFATLPDLNNLFITKQEYDEHGSHIINKKCF